MLQRQLKTEAALAAITVVLGASLAAAQDYPEEPVVEPPLPEVGTQSSEVERDTPPWRQRTWVGTGAVTHGGYGGPLVRASNVNGDAALFVGGRGGWLVNHHLFLGGGGMGQALNLDAPSLYLDEDPNARNLEFGYGGFLLGYHLMPDQVVHGFFSVLVGGGGLALSDRHGNHNVDDHGDALFVLEPEVALETNVVDFMRVQFTLSYRKVWGVELESLTNRDISGLSAGTALAFGLF